MSDPVFIIDGDAIKYWCGQYLPDSLNHHLFLLARCGAMYVSVILLACIAIDWRRLSQALPASAQHAGTIRLHGSLSESNQPPGPKPDDAVATVASSLEGSRPPRINLPLQEPGTRRLIERAFDGLMRGGAAATVSWTAGRRNDDGTSNNVRRRVWLLHHTIGNDGETKCRRRRLDVTARRQHLTATTLRSRAPAQAYLCPPASLRGGALESRLQTSNARTHLCSAVSSILWSSPVRPVVIPSKQPQSKDCAVWSRPHLCGTVSPRNTPSAAASRRFPT